MVMNEMGEIEDYDKLMVADKTLNKLIKAKGWFVVFIGHTMFGTWRVLIRDRAKNGPDAVEIVVDALSQIECLEAATKKLLAA